jgi:hypothetical protein
VLRSYREAIKGRYLDIQQHLLHKIPVCLVATGFDHMSISSLPILLPVDGYLLSHRLPAKS